MQGKKEKPKPDRRTIALATEVHERLATWADREGMLVGRLAEKLIVQGLDRLSGRTAA